MNKKGIFNKFKNDSVFRNRFTLTFSFTWGLLLTIYYLLIGIYSSIQKTPWVWSWFLSLSVWYLVIIIFKLLLMINAFRIKNEKWIDFKLLTIVYMFINLVEVLLITISPNFFTTTFGSKINTAITISSLVVSTINILIFVLNWFSVNREKFTHNEADFIQCKKYIGRTEGFFNMMLIAINILILCKLPEKVIGYSYLIIGATFAALSLYIAIKLIKQRKWDKHHNKKEV